MTNPFQKAIKTKAKGRMCLTGPSGSGKTFTALSIATALGGNIAVLDTEHGSATKYADVFTFDVLEIANFHPDNFTKAIKDAYTAGYGVLILDSLSHAWNGIGGSLFLVQQLIDSGKFTKFTAWEKITPIQNKMIEAIIQTPIHIIATMRAKTAYVVDSVEGDNGRTRSVPRKVGLEPVQREGFEYEFDVTATLTMDNVMVIDKTRCSALKGRTFDRAGADVAGILSEWLDGGAEPSPLIKLQQTFKELRAELQALSIAVPAFDGTAFKALDEPKQIALLTAINAEMEALRPIND